MTNPAETPTNVDLFTEHGINFDEDQTDDLDFQPRPQRSVHWLTLTLLGLTLWALGFLVGVLVDRAIMRA